jgi:hypothetical protein
LLPYFKRAEEAQKISSIVHGAVSEADAAVEEINKKLLGKRGPVKVRTYIHDLVGHI